MDTININPKKTELTDTSCREAVSLKCNIENKSLSDNLIDLQQYLTQNFPGATLIPSRDGGKIPLHKHKDGQYTTDMFISKGYMECVNGCLIILPEDLVVIDVDDESYCETLEQSVPEMLMTVCCQTKKGRHYYFRSTPRSIEANIQDGARRLKQTSGEPFPIDIKTKTVKGTGGLISIPPSPNKTWIRKLGEAEVLPLPDTLVDFYLKYSTIPPPTHTFSYPSHQNHELQDRSDVIRFVNMLDKRRATNYDEWIQLGWCLHNISDSLLEVWDEFSQNNPHKYQKGECARLWGTMRNEGLRFGTLCMWAKYDNAEEYNKYQGEKVFMDIKNCNGSHTSIANIAHKLYSKQFVCVSSKGKLWYRFNGTLWEEDHEAIGLRREISKGLRDQFLHVLIKVRTSECDNMSSASSANSTVKDLCERLLKISFKLEDCGFKDCLIREMREHFLDKKFLKELDANPNLIAFTNGVWDLKQGIFRLATPDDKLSLSVGYPYNQIRDATIYQQIKDYFGKLHPTFEQRQYVLKTLARQLYGDNGSALFHIHAGVKGSAGNGKSCFFEVLELALGQYVHKFAVETLVVKQRGEPNRPAPELQNWRGRRILYCSEPNADDKLHSGIMKELTGGETLAYRLLFCNETHKFKPMYKMHIMCNDTPQLDGSDQGIKRRIRKIDYISKFVDAGDVDEPNNMYLKDMGFTEMFHRDYAYRMEFFRYVIDHYNHSFAYEMPTIIKDNSIAYLDDNNQVLKFVNEFIVPDPDGHFTLKHAKDIFRNSDYYTPQVNLKIALEKILKTSCVDQKRVGNVKLRGVYCGFKLEINEVLDYID